MSKSALKILLIDDDRMQFRLTQAQFRKIRAEAYELDWAETYEEGLEKLLSGAYARACWTTGWATATAWNSSSRRWGRGAARQLSS